MLFIFLLFIIIKSNIVNNLINGNIFLLKDRSLTRWVIFGITNLCQNTHFTYKLLQYTCSNWTFYTYILTGHVICLHTTNYSIFNIQDFIYWLCISIWDCFGPGRYLGMVGMFYSDDPCFWDFLSEWVRILCLITTWLTPSFCGKISLSLSHLVPEILGPKVGLICRQYVLYSSF